MRVLGCCLWGNRFSESPPEFVIVGIAERTFADASLDAYQSIRPVHEKGPWDYYWGTIGSLTNQDTRRWIEQLLKKKKLLMSMKSRLISRRPPIVNLDSGKVFRTVPKPDAAEPESLARVVAILRDYHTAIEERGSHLIVMPVPEKETVYFDMIPERYGSRQTPSEFLVDLVRALRAAGMHTVDLLSRYRFERAHSDQLLYELDDTHWTPHGSAVAVEELLQLARSINAPSRPVEEVLSKNREQQRENRGHPLFWTGIEHRFADRGFLFRFLAEFVQARPFCC